MEPDLIWKCEGDRSFVSSGNNEFKHVVSTKKHVMIQFPSQNVVILDHFSGEKISDEKDKKLACVPFYEDNNQSLNTLAIKFIKEKNIKISQETINLIVERARGDRGN